MQLPDNLFNATDSDPLEPDHKHIHHLYDFTVHIRLNWYELAVAACIATFIIKWILTR